MSEPAAGNELVCMKRAEEGLAWGGSVDPANISKQLREAAIEGKGAEALTKHVWFWIALRLL